MNNRGIAPIVLILWIAGGLSGCAWMGGAGRISLPGVSVKGVKDAGSPAQVATSQTGVSIALPKGSRIVKREIKGLGYRPATKTSTEQKETPAVTETEIIPGGETTYVQTESSVKADTGTVDTSVKNHEIDVEAKKPLLYASIVCALLAGFFVYRAYPTPAICAGAASIVFFLAWHIELPGWVAAIALAAVVGGGFLYIGHERGLSTPK